jgi:hypothetical protein
MAAQRTPLLGCDGELLEHFHGFSNTGFTLSHFRCKNKNAPKVGHPMYFSIVYFHLSLRPGAMICNIPAGVFQFDY